MEDIIRVNVDCIINYINYKILLNNMKNNITKTDNKFKIEIEFRDKYKTYKTDEFKQLLNEYCKKNSITYKMNELRPGIVDLIVELEEFR